MEFKVDKKKIAKNTMLLYLRMLLVMGVSLITTRVVLRNLGAIDYGIFNVVGGVVTMFAFLNSSMSAATQRYLSYETGINEESRLRKVFGLSIVIHVVIALVILIIAETLGLWFVGNEMNFPQVRFNAALWVYHLAVASFLVNVICVPYHAAIIAHENMNFYAWISISDVLLKLGIAYLISTTGYDKLQAYSTFLLIASIITNSCYIIFCLYNYKECKIKIDFDKKKFSEMFSFASWNIVGNLAYALRVQGSNILLNIFFGPAVNAARGLSHQVDSAVESFVTNFQTASNPQIVKTYATGNYDDSLNLVCQCSKFSFFLMLVLSIPLIFQMDYILSLWLGDVPRYTSVFVQLILLNGLVDSLSKALKTYVKATGEIKWYMIIQGGFFLLALPVIYIVLKLGGSPPSSVAILLAFTIIGTFLRIELVRRVAKGFSTTFFAKNVVKYSILCSLVIFPVCYIINQYLVLEGIQGLILKTSCLILVVLFSIWVLGLNRAEKIYVSSMIKRILMK